MDWLAAWSYRPICKGALDLVREEHHYVPIMDDQQSQRCEAGVWAAGIVVSPFHGWLVSPEKVQDWACVSISLWVSAAVAEAHL